MTKLHEWLNTALIGIVCLLVLFGGQSAPEPTSQFGGTRFPNGISADSTSPSAGQVRSTTLNVTGAATLSSTASVGGLITLNAGQLRSYSNATSTTATTYTLVESDIINYDTVLMTPNTGALTVTLPATSTLTSMIPSAGDMHEQCWLNATSTGAATITFAAGTGIDLESATSSLAVAAQGSACLTYIREPDTDVTVLFNRYLNAD